MEHAEATFKAFDTHTTLAPILTALLRWSSGSRLAHSHLVCLVPVCKQNRVAMMTDGDPIALQGRLVPLLLLHIIRPLILTSHRGQALSTGNAQYGTASSLPNIIKIVTLKKKRGLVAIQVQDRLHCGICVAVL